MSQPKCPGTSSELAGTAEACEGCPNASYCQQPKEKDQDIDFIKNKTRNLQATIAIMSGKGGVGKSTFTYNLSVEISNKKRVLLIDLDLSGPSIPRLTKTEDQVVFENSNEIVPIKISETLDVLSIGNFQRKNVIYGSKTKNSIIKNFLKNTDFNNYDFVIFDTPPGITDEHLAIINFLNLSFAIMITTPQKIAFSDVIRQIDLCRRTRIPILGIVENMKVYECENCSHCNFIFTSCDVEEYCKKHEIKYLGDIKLKKSIAIAGDTGQSFIDETIINVAKFSIEAAPEFFKIENKG